jgi:hypothetical protein
LVFGRWPFLLLRKEMAIFASYRIRGSIRFSSFVINPSLRVLGQAFLAFFDMLIARAGVKLPKLSRATSANSFFSQEPLGDDDRSYLRAIAPSCADAILCDYAKLTPAIEAIGIPDAPSAVIMHDLFSAVYPDVDAATEFSLLANAGLIIAIQQDEASIVANKLPNHPIIVAPMAVSTVAAAAPGEADRLLFVGSHTLPNVEALRWFADHVWPILQQRRPTLTLDVAGTVSRGTGPVPTGIRMLGLVADLGDLYRRAGIIVSPLRSGTGLKIKLIEAMSRGKAIVATTVTAQGVTDLVGEIVRIADDPVSFAEEILALASNDAQRETLGVAGIQLVRDRFNPDRCYAPIYDHLTASKCLRSL